MQRAGDGRLQEGDRVLVPAITSCGRCRSCKEGMAAHCAALGGIGCIFGHLVDGVQAELARVPYSETSVHVVPSARRALRRHADRAERRRRGAGRARRDGRPRRRVAIGAVGIPETIDLCTRIVRAGGRVANIGVHGAPTTLHLEGLWIKNITITTGLVSGSTIPTLMLLVRDGRIEPEKLGTHRVALGDIGQAYDVSAAAGENDALKVVLAG